MRRKKPVAPVVADQLDCFGDYTKNNPLCAKHCALRLRCVIEQNHNIRMEVLADLATAESMNITIQ
jgi:hypothetical protein